MRVAPIGLIGHQYPDLAFKSAADAAALTHGHPSGYLSAGFLGSLIAYLVQGEDLPAAIDRSIEILMVWPKHEECLAAVEKAASMYQKASPAPETIELLGSGWVGEEALAISLFCSLHYQDDFVGGVLTAINHSGDSDSTGAITGNILGVLLGVEAIPPTWIEHLSLVEIVRQIALDLKVGVRGNFFVADQEWIEKYPPY
jgi:ADP-ribosylglycohydrolase